MPTFITMGKLIRLQKYIFWICTKDNTNTFNWMPAVTSNKSFVIFLMNRRFYNKIVSSKDQKSKAEKKLETNE